MTNRVTLGFDPGLKGAIAVLADGEPVQFIDLPTEAHPRKGNRIAARELIASLRGIRQQYRGAHVFACVEEIAMRSTNARGSDQKSGEGFGILLCALAAVDIPNTEVYPQTWKRQFHFIKKPKDAPRRAAMQRWPKIANELKLKKHDGRADALYIALWGYETEAWM